MKLLFKRSYMTDLYARPDLTSQTMANQDAESFLQGVKLDDSRPPACAPTTPVNPGSN